MSSADVLAFRAPGREAQVNVFLLGKGRVGGRLLAHLAQNEVALRARNRVWLRLVGIADSRRALFDDGGFSPAEALARLSSVPPSSGSPPNVRPLLTGLARLPVPVLVDCTAADGMDVLYEEAFRRGIHVVGANKKPLASQWPVRDALERLARDHGRAWHYETTVGASLPVIRTIQDLVRTGDRVERIEGAFSGTLGFLSHQLAAGVPLSQAVREARDRGYSEPHPRDDLSGLDVARKALILAREAGAAVDLPEVAVEPFVPRELLREDDPERFLSAIASLDAELEAYVGRLRSARKFLRYLARIEPDGRGGAQVRVGPVAVDGDHPAASLRAAEAMVAFFTERYREYPLVVRGVGAGGDVTAAGVLADVLRVAEGAFACR
jgi:bifunctional aspartokinase / homoserine dehydrogenase 1